ncbi:MAG: hypothetical protein V1648_00495 [Candidatus Aenigmatarchaeota archaeon]
MYCIITCQADTTSCDKHACPDDYDQVGCTSGCEYDCGASCQPPTYPCSCSGTSRTWCSSGTCDCEIVEDCGTICTDSCARKTCVNDAYGGTCGGSVGCGDYTCSSGTGCTTTCSEICGATCDANADCDGSDGCYGTCGTGTDSCKWRDYWCDLGATCECDYSALDADGASGRCTGCSQNWATGGSGDCTGESGCTTACCGDDSGEKYRYCQKSGAISWACSSSNDTCCDSTTDCIDPSALTCKVGANAIGGSPANDKYANCVSGTWNDCDDSGYYGTCGASYCGNASGVRCGEGAACAIGEYADNTTLECCGDDASENYNYFSAGASLDNGKASNASDYRCCSASTDCVLNGVCYATGSSPSDVDGDGDTDYCSSGTWQDCNADLHCSLGSCVSNDCITESDCTGTSPSPCNMCDVDAANVTIQAPGGSTLGPYQMLFYAEAGTCTAANPKNETWNYSLGYGFCPTEGAYNATVKFHAQGDAWVWESASPATIYNVTWDQNQSWCDCKLGSSACGGSTCFNTTGMEWEAGTTSKCCGDDAGENYLSCVDSSANGNCGSSTMACCTENTKCVDSNGNCQTTGSCHVFGSGGLNSYCSSGTWEDPDESSAYCTASGCAYTWFTNTPVSGTSCCGDDTTGDNTYYYSGLPSSATSLTCERCNAGSYVSAVTYYGNGYTIGSGTVRKCHYGDITCNAAAAANGSSQDVYGWGWYTGDLASSTTVECKSGAGACSDGASSNDSSSNLYGNGYVAGMKCFHGNIVCSSGSEANGTSCDLECSGVGSECCSDQGTYTDSITCTESGGCDYTDHNRDSDEAYCTSVASGCTAYDWSIGGEINATVCCGDDSGENTRLRFCSSWCASNASDNACCNAANKCVYQDTCYSNAACYSDDAYCSAGTWRDSDDGQTYCDACEAPLRWSLGGEISPATCCGDDAGENHAYRLADGGMDNDWATNASDDACCNAANKCVADSTCYASGSRSDADNDGDDDYCNAGTWYDCAIQSDCPLTYNCYGGDCVDVIDLSYVLPTPSHGSVNIDNSVTINVTANDTQGNSIDTCTLSWDGVNETMTKHGSGTYVTCHTDKATVAGQSYTFRAFANDSAGVIELENERTFRENTAPALTAIYMNVSYVKSGDTVIITSSGASDGDGDTYYMRCGNTSGNENVCNSTLGSGERNCTFASAWSDNSQHLVYCRLYDGYEYSSERNATITADNTPPTPEPAQVSSLALGSAAATVTSVAASDGGSGLHATAYRFYDSGVWSAWQASNVYTNSSLAPNTMHCFRTQYRDNVSNIGTQSNETCNYTLADQPSISRVACYYSGTHSCIVNFSMASNPSGVDYYIEETTANAGGSDENWTTWYGEPSYTDGVSLPHTQYCYRIKARNQNDAETAYSSAVCNTTYNNLPSAANVKTYDSTMAQKSSLRAGRMIYIRADATDGDGAGDMESVQIRIRNNESDIMVNNADMTPVSSIMNGYTYQYQYTIPSNADGVWQIEITATDLGAAESVAYASFTVVSLKLNIKLVLNETQASTYVPGAGEKSFADLTYAYYAIPQNYYIASYYANSLYGLVFQNQQPLGVLVDKSVDSVTLGLDLKYPNSIAFVVSSKGDWKSMQNRIGLINSGSFMQYSEPTFSFGLGDKYPMAIVLNYDNMDILGRRMDVGKGSNNIAIRHEGLYDENIGLNISRK